MFFLLKNTVFKGRLGPDIGEFGIYENRKVDATEPQPWEVNFIDAELSKEDQHYNKRNGTVAFLVFKNEQLIFEYTNEEYADTAHFNLWSSTKSIVSLLIGCAIDEGLIKGVEQPIEEILGEKYEGSGITIKHLLTMSSGINFTESYINPFSYAARGLYDFDLPELHEGYGPDKEPGKYFNYQSGNTQLLAMIVIKVTGKNLAEYASEKLWIPMHAEHPAYWSLDHADGMERAFCCFNTNARDFARFGKLAMHFGVWEGDTLVNPEYFKDAVTPADILNPDGTECKSYGYQWWTLDLPNYQGFYTRGIQGQYVFVLPAEDLIIVRMGHKRDRIPQDGHISDVFNYIDMGRSIAAQMK